MVRRNRKGEKGRRLSEAESQTLDLNENEEKSPEPGNKTRVSSSSSNSSSNSSSTTTTKSAPKSSSATTIAAPSPQDKNVQKIKELENSLKHLSKPPKGEFPKSLFVIILLLMIVCVALLEAYIGYSLVRDETTASTELTTTTLDTTNAPPEKRFGPLGAFRSFVGVFVFYSVLAFFGLLLIGYLVNKFFK
jgi:hypothetical protein